MISQTVEMGQEWAWTSFVSEPWHSLLVFPSGLKDPGVGSAAVGEHGRALKPAPVSGPTDQRTAGRPPSWGPPRLPSQHPLRWAATTPTWRCPTPTHHAAPSAPNCSVPP